MSRPALALAALSFAGTLSCLAPPVRAQTDAGLPAAMQLAWTDVAPHVDTARGVVAATSLAVADERRGPLAARRLWSRREAEARAREALHAWADAALARVAVDGPTIQAVHHAIDTHAEVAATRARVDGSACVEVVVSLGDLASATPRTRGLPWSA